MYLNCTWLVFPHPNTSRKYSHNLVVVTSMFLLGEYLFKVNPVNVLSVSFAHPLVGFLFFALVGMNVISV